MFFNRNKKQNTVEVFSCVDGDIVPLEDVPDPIFSKHLMGEGIAINPENDTVFAPCEGEITIISEQEHAIGITTENGCEIMIHVGIDTAGLQGQAFEMLTRVHDYVYAGTPLLCFERDVIQKHELCPYVMLIALHNDEFDVEIEKEKGHVQANEDILFTVTR